MSWQQEGIRSEETRMRWSALQFKVFLQHRNPLLTFPTFTGWSIIKVFNQGLASPDQAYSKLHPTVAKKTISRGYCKTHIACWDGKCDRCEPMGTIDRLTGGGGDLEACLSGTYCHLRIPTIWRHATNFTIPKPNKPLNETKSYRPISVLCVPFKIPECLIYACMESVIDPKLPLEQADSCRRGSTVNQVTMLTQHFKDGFEAKQKSGAIFAYLTAAYDTVWCHGLTCNLLHLVSDNSFGNNPKSCLRRLKNGILQWSVLALRLFNINMCDLTSTTSSKYAYVKDLAFMHTGTCWLEVEKILSQDMAILSDNHTNWGLKLSQAKLRSAIEEANREVEIKINGRSVVHLENYKLTSHITIMRRIVGTGSAANDETLHISLARVYTTVTYCATSWSCSPHTNIIDKFLNNAMYMVNGYLHPTPMDYPPILAGFSSAELRCHTALRIFLKHPPLNQSSHLVSESTTNKRWLKSRCPRFGTAVQGLSKNNAQTKQLSAAEWMMINWNYKLGLLPSTSCECGMGEQSADYIISECLIYRAKHGACGLQHQVESSYSKAGLTSIPNKKHQKNIKKWMSSGTNICKVFSWYAQQAMVFLQHLNPTFTGWPTYSTPSDFEWK